MCLSASAEYCDGDDDDRASGYSIRQRKNDSNPRNERMGKVKGSTAITASKRV